MNFLKRAWCNVTRKPTKSILLAITFFVIGNLVILGLGISNSAENAKTMTRKQMRAVVKYEVDFEPYWKYCDSIEDETERQQAYSNQPRIRTEDVEPLMRDERVVAMNFLQNFTIHVKNLDPIPTGNNNNDEEIMGGVDENGNTIEATVQPRPNFLMVATYSTSMIELYEGTYTVDSGRFISAEDIEDQNAVCLITRQVADQDGITVGDTLVIETDDYWTRRNLEEKGRDTSMFTKEFEVIGIFESKKVVDPNASNYDYMQNYENPQNIVIVPMTTQAQWRYDMENARVSYYREEYPGQNTYEPSIDDYMSGSPTLLLRDPLEVEAFVADHQDSLKEYTKFETDNETFEKLARPLHTLSFFANIIVWIVTFNAIVIISLVTALTLKTREFEICVLLSIGVTKMKVIAQLFTELMLVALVGFTLAVFSGTLAAGWVGDKVMEFQNSSQFADLEEETNNNNYYDAWSQDYFSKVSQADLLQQYHVEIQPIIILEIYVIGVVVVFIAIMIPCGMIMRLNPKQILLNTN